MLHALWARRLVESQPGVTTGRRVMRARKALRRAQDARDRHPASPWTSTAPAARRSPTGIGFLDHMLTSLATHGRFDLDVRCKGDLHVDAHHSVEDVGIALGQALRAGPGRQEGHRALRPRLRARSTRRSRAA